MRKSSESKRRLTVVHRLDRIINFYMEATLRYLEIRARSTD